MKAKKTNGRGRDYSPLRFKRVRTPGMSSPCIVPASHKAHSSGYVYVVPRDGMGQKAQRLHRIAYLKTHGSDSIPKGWEIDHICGNRTCCNPKHLRAIERSDHTRITLMAAREERMEAAWGIWEREGRPGSSALHRILGIPEQTLNRYIHRWRVEDEALAEWKAKALAA